MSGSAYDDWKRAVEYAQNRADARNRAAEDAWNRVAEGFFIYMPIMIACIPLIAVSTVAVIAGVGALATSNPVTTVTKGLNFLYEQSRQRDGYRLAAVASAGVAAAGLTYYYCKPQI